MKISVRGKRGAFSSEKARRSVLRAVYDLRITPKNKRLAVDYLCNGVSVRHFGMSRQCAYQLINRVLNQMVKNGDLYI
jgi:hypothetical protein